MSATASLNDFKLLNIKCKKYFELYSKGAIFLTPPKTDKLKERFGFYLFMLENLCDEKDLDRIYLASINLAGSASIILAG